MFKMQITKVAMVLMAVAGISLIGCSNKSNEDGYAGSIPNMDSIARQVAMAPAEMGSKRIRIGAPSDTSLPVAGTIHDLAVADSLVVAALDNGVLTYNLNRGTHTTTVLGQPISSVAWHDGQAFAGGDKLYRLEEGVLLPTDESLAEPITTLYSYGALLMIGTENGLYARTTLGVTPLMEGVWVTSMAADQKGLWVGTDGQGLYRWDGDTFAKRYLARDSSLFDYVNCLSFGHGHLYLGTDSGMYVYDGGNWQTLTTANGLPSDGITAIDASRWIVYIGTDAGVVSHFNGSFDPVPTLDNQCATVIKHSSKGLLVGTDINGLLLRSGAAVRTLVAPKDADALAASWLDK